MSVTHLKPGEMAVPLRGEELRLFTLNFKRKVKVLKKNSIIKNVEYVIQNVGGKLVTVKLDPPRNLKINNKAKGEK